MDKAQVRRILGILMRCMNDQRVGRTKACRKSGITAIAYETLKDRAGRLPLLTPMSEIAGKMSIQEGAKYLERPFDGRGILLAGVPGPVSLQHVDCALSRFLRHRRVAEGIVVVAGVAVRAIVAILLIGAWRRKQQLAESGGG